jgi:DNA-binding FrmR family transcriptional regulator
LTPAGDASRKSSSILHPSIKALMPHTPEEKKRAVTRLKRIRGQADALIAAVERGEPCGALLQQLSALRGAATGLMAEVLESHLRETLMGQACGDQNVHDHAPASEPAEIGEIMRVIRPYLK